MSAHRNLAVLVERRDRIREWLAGQTEPTNSEQKHLDVGTPEQAYWHHGYQAALDDMLKLLTT
jgi:hypothetical protein